MKNLSLTSLVLVVASCASTTPSNTSTPTGQVAELDPFKSQLVESGRTKNFRIYDVVVQDVPTRVKLCSLGDDDSSTPRHRILETQPALVVTVLFDTCPEWEDVGEDDAWHDEVELVLPADRLSPELTAQIRELSDETWWRPIDNRRRLNKRRELARNYLKLEVREHLKDLQVIDSSRSFACPKNYVIESLSGRGVDDFVVLRRTVKVVTLVAEPPTSELTADSYDD